MVGKESPWPRGKPDGPLIPQRTGAREGQAWESLGLPSCPMGGQDPEEESPGTRPPVEGTAPQPPAPQHECFPGGEEGGIEPPPQGGSPCCLPLPEPPCWDTKLYQWPSDFLACPSWLWASDEVPAPTSRVLKQLVYRPHPGQPRPRPQTRPALPPQFRLRG